MLSNPTQKIKSLETVRFQSFLIGANVYIGFGEIQFY